MQEYSHTNYEDDADFPDHLCSTVDLVVLLLLVLLLKLYCFILRVQHSLGKWVNILSWHKKVVKAQAVV